MKIMILSDKINSQGKVKLQAMLLCTKKEVNNRRLQVVLSEIMVQLQWILRIMSQGSFQNRKKLLALNLTF